MKKTLELLPFIIIGLFIGYLMPLSQKKEYCGQIIDMGYNNRFYVVLKDSTINHYINISGQEYYNLKPNEYTCITKQL